MSTKCARFVHTQQVNTPLTCRNTAPKVGLEPASSPRKHREAREHTESEAVRHQSDPIRRPKCAHCVHPVFCPPTVTPAGRQLSATDVGSALLPPVQHHGQRLLPYEGISLLSTGSSAAFNLCEPCQGSSYRHGGPKPGPVRHQAPSQTRSESFTSTLREVHTNHFASTLT